MTVFRRLSMLLLLVFCLFFAYPPHRSCAQESPAQLELLQQQNQQLHRQLQDARRELARLKAEGSEPGWQDVAAGLGIIFGLCGVIMMVNVRRR